jgi:hypothetical protein
MIEYLLSENAWEQRSYDERWFFCFNVKAYVDLDFDHLLEIWVKDGEGGEEYEKDEAFIQRLREAYKGNPNLVENLWSIAIEDVRRGFVGGPDGSPDHDSYTAHWSEDIPYHVRFSFEGRSGGWLVLEEFGLGDQKYKLHANAIEFHAEEDQGDDPSYIDTMGTDTLRQLCVLVSMLSNDLEGDKPKREVEYQAAFNLFVNYLSEVKTSDEIREKFSDQVFPEGSGFNLPNYSPGILADAATKDDVVCLIDTLKSIAVAGGNLGDDRFTDASGPNDARQRGLMYIGARSMAASALKKLEGKVGSW